jgi:hypothetical protein
VSKWRWLGFSLVLIGVVALIIAIGHKSGPQSLPVVRNTSSPAPSASAKTVARVVPTRVVIPAIGVNAAVEPVGLTKGGALATPPLSARNLTGWWDGGYAPGQDGPAVIVGHIDSAAAGPLVFYHLGGLKPGDVAYTEPGNLKFTVTQVQEVSKNRFPTQTVYGKTSRPTLRLITCGGNFNSSTGHYDDNIIVYAVEG